jgi:hypothetical protein
MQKRKRDGDAEWRMQSGEEQGIDWPRHMIFEEMLMSNWRLQCG